MCFSSHFMFLLITKQWQNQSSPRTKAKHLFTRSNFLFWLSQLVGCEIATVSAFVRHVDTNLPPPDNLCSLLWVSFSYLFQMVQLTSILTNCISKIFNMQPIGKRLCWCICNGSVITITKGELCFSHSCNKYVLNPKIVIRLFTSGQCSRKVSNYFNFAPTIQNDSSNTIFGTILFS